jgi:DNA (cytosine-5)-methyltransferase 1
MTFTVGSLFSGVGGLDLGFERAGFKVAWMCEADPFCRRVLNKHWPEVPVYEDVRTLRGADVFRPDGLIGGFPCQDVSDSGRHWERDGIDGARSGLWAEYFRLVCELRPRFIAVENVSGLLSRGMGRVLGDLASVGYDAEWESLPAGAFGTPHLRTRVFMVAYPNGLGCDGPPQRHFAFRLFKCFSPQRVGLSELPESAVCRVDHDIPGRVDRNRSLGNAVVPDVARYMAECVMEALCGGLEAAA